MGQQSRSKKARRLQTPAALDTLTDKQVRRLRRYLGLPALPVAPAPVKEAKP